MAELMAVASVVATLAGAGITAAGTIAAGDSTEKIAEFEAKQLEAKGKEEQAAGQKEAREYRRKKELALSRNQTVAAASGFSATDPTALALQDEIARYGTYQEQMAQYGGESRRSGLEGQAAGRRYEGKAEKRASRFRAAGTILGTAGSLAGKYGGGTGGSSGGTSLRYG